MVGRLVQRAAIQARTVAPRGLVVALAAGALLGAAVSVPYEQVLGLSSTACAILRSAVASAVLSGLCTARSSDLVFDARALLDAPEAEHALARNPEGLLDVLMQSAQTS